MVTKKKIVTIGGGSGTPVLNEALIRAGANFITSIVTVMDSGGITGRMRTDSYGQDVAYSDGLRTLLSLLPPSGPQQKQIANLKSFLRKRNDREQDLGYTIFSHYFSKERGFLDITEMLENLTGLKFLGRVLPVTTTSTQIIFKTHSGQIFVGEHELDNRRMSADKVAKIWLSPQPTGYPEAIAAIQSADLIFFACGSLHGSILVNLLPKGIGVALQKSGAKKILLTNLASAKNETDQFTPTDFVSIFRRYLNMAKPLDYLLIPHLSQTAFTQRYPEVARKYLWESSHFLGWEKADVDLASRLGVKILTHHATSIDRVYHRLRHDPKRLAASLKYFL